MKSKTFSGDSEAEIIRSVNDWLAGERGVSVRDSKTRHETDPGTGRQRILFEVWYDQA